VQRLDQGRRRAEIHRPDSSSAGSAAEITA
jgi:hypothetical protein